MSPATTDQVKTALTAYPGIAAVAVTEHDDQGDHYTVAYVAPDGPGLDTTALPAPDLDGLLVLAGRIGTALGIRMSMADLFKAPTAGDLDQRIDHLTTTRK